MSAAAPHSFLSVFDSSAEQNQVREQPQAQREPADVAPGSDRARQFRAVQAITFVTGLE